MDFPLPPGAEDWRVVAADSCRDLDRIGAGGAEVVLRVPVATWDCPQGARGAEPFVIVTGEDQRTFGREEEVRVPGFGGTVTTFLTPLSREFYYSAEPPGGDVTWIFVFDGSGARAGSVDDALAALLAPS